MIDQPVALVTGAGRNIGREIALALAASGHAVAVNVRASVDEGRAVVKEIEQSGGRALLCVADVGDRAAVGAMVDAVTQAWGRLDVLVNNAAVRREAALADLTVADWHDTLRVVLDGAFFCTQAALPLLKASTQAAIINIGGLTAHTGAANRVHVVTAKAGLVGMTKALAQEVASRGITVNMVAPGFIATPMTHALTDAQKAKLNEQIPLGRMGDPTDIAAAVLYLASTEAGWVTGATLHVNGGMAMI